MIEYFLPNLGILVTAVGIPILYLQLRDLKASLRSSTHASIYSQAESIRGYLIEYPELRKYFFDNCLINQENKDYNRVLSIAEVYLNYLEQIAVLRKSLGEENLTSLKLFLDTALSKSPILKQHLRENASLYSQALHEMVKNPISNSQTSSNSINPNTMTESMKNYITSSESMAWKPLIEEGVDTQELYVKVLRYDEQEKRAPTFLLKFEPGSSYPYHNHPAGEEAFILEGEAYFNDQKLVKGDYLYTPPTFKHSVKSEKGCVILFRVPQEVEIQ
ncbi:cupin domain-containing protein [Algoriphagus sp. PAP.12]|uniref:cupin domain-containing protein n=1 Tax=Algoriphagus sp. PAP.12 TaxID=2996678 RepID=UPI00227CE55A|nr:cupin domain-containing protein [Algoriphagus sp. PAP.12]